MAKRETRLLVILTGVSCLVVALWIGIQQFAASDQSAHQKTKVQIGKSRESGNPPRKKPKARSLEELQNILSEARERWANLASSRYFFEDFADEIVAKFSTAEIEILGFDCTRTDRRTSLGFENAIMRRWGRLGFEQANNRLVETYAVIEELGWEVSSLLKVQEEFYVNLRIGRSFDAPQEIISGIIKDTRANIQVSPNLISPRIESLLKK